MRITRSFEVQENYRFLAVVVVVVVMGLACCVGLQLVEGVKQEGLGLGISSGSWSETIQDYSGGRSMSEY